MNSTTIVIFGASGDLARRKLLPALHHLFASGLLPQNFAILGTGRSPYTDSSFRQRLCTELDKEGKEQQRTESFCQHLYYQPTDTSNDDDFLLLKQRLAELAK
ncbi:MAG: glucose-6-phosphate dehydrogenase, partial [Gammaproteobacteria bacterium]